MNIIDCACGNNIHRVQPIQLFTSHFTTHLGCNKFLSKEDLDAAAAAAGDVQSDFIANLRGVLVFLGRVTDPCSSSRASNVRLTRTRVRAQRGGRTCQCGDRLSTVKHELNPTLTQTLPMR
jgi:hypothetical protein